MCNWRWDSAPCKEITTVETETEEITTVETETTGSGDQVAFGSEF